MRFALSTVFISCLALFAPASTTALNVRGTNDVVRPKVLYPHEGTVWKPFEEHDVVWDTTDLPKSITNPVGKILVRTGNFTMPLILEEGFNITIGRKMIQVPWLMEGQYQIVLMGDSGNFSPPFKIGKRVVPSGPK